ncbi:hypothetical protein FSY59_02075 [Comamonas sp. Z3]|uniref:hypothetical protein n=1 Tax=Comamonas sp. Z3 TaxID=2601247 RepID=UPI0011E6F6DA|nr:hypothetical protein [Comamonas sp. Z3]TYK73429.1 hypothetical protein FSY59_02075 [Comamonas sp. Z3]
MDFLVHVPDRDIKTSYTPHQLLVSFLPGKNIPTKVPTNIILTPFAVQIWMALQREARPCANAPSCRSRGEHAQEAQ